MPQVKTGKKELGWAVHSSVDFLSKVNEGWERKCRLVQDNEEIHPLTSSTSRLISQKVAGDKEEFSKLEMGLSWSCSARESKRGKAADKAALPGNAVNGPEFVHSKVKAGEIIYHYLLLKRLKCVINHLFLCIKALVVLCRPLLIHSSVFAEVQ